MRLLKCDQVKNTRPYHIINCIFFTIISLTSYAQDSGSETLINKLFAGIQSTSDDRRKIAMNDSIDLIISSYVRSDSVLTHKFGNLKNLGQVESPDLKLKIINWNLVLRDGSNKYFLYIIRKGEKKGSENKVFTLRGENKSRPPDSLGTFNQSNWYGALYYSIQPFRHGKENCYLLLGIDFGKDMITRKLIDILTFDEKGDPMFGKECFLRDGKLKSRHVIEYSSDGLISLRLESRKLVVFDRVSPYSSGHTSASLFMGAGLLFDGYRLKRGLWNYVENVDIRNSKKK